LEKAYQDREEKMYWLKVEPPFEPLRNDPRWQEMLDKVGSLNNLTGRYWPKAVIDERSETTQSGRS